jgi:hypothetical protein
VVLIIEKIAEQLPPLKHYQDKIVQKALWLLFLNVTVQLVNQPPRLRLTQAKVIMLTVVKQIRISRSPSQPLPKFSSSKEKKALFVCPSL